MNLLLHIIGLAVLALIIIGPLALAAVRSGQIFGDPIALNVAGSYEAGTTRSAEVAITAPHLLVKQGTADGEVDLCGANDMPWGAAADAVPIDHPVGVHLLAGGGHTIVMVASEAIDAGEEVYTAAAGKVSDLSATGGTYYKVGRALRAAAADGDEVEVMPCYPVATVVS